MLFRTRPGSAMRLGDWKLIEYLDGSGDVELYHLSQDLSETNDLAAESQGRVNEILLYVGLTPKGERERTTHQA